jgi:hypothetical protein
MPVMFLSDVARIVSLTLALLASAPQSVSAQDSTQQAVTPEPGSQLTIYLMTMGQGNDVYERFGHNAILVRDSSGSIAIAYNYGVFDFDEPGFITRFVRGRMDYMLAAFSLDLTLQTYQERNRSIWLQELALTPAQRVALVEFLEWNRLPENRLYRYDYFRDNCSTRARDALDRALDGALRSALLNKPTHTTYRFHALRLTGNCFTSCSIDVPIQAGIHFGLGPATDEPIDAWQESFIPMRLRDHLRDIRVSDGRGGTMPLVVSEQTLFEATRSAELAQPPNRVIHYLAIGLLVGLLIAAFGYLGPVNRLAAALFVFLVVFWELLLGLLGLVLVGLWAFTDHVTSYANLNLFHASPLALVMAVLVPMSLLRRKEPSRGVLMLAGLIIVFSIVGIAIKAFPGVRQWNLEIILLLLPTHMAVFWSLVRWRLPVPSAGGDRTSSVRRSRTARAESHKH